MTIKRSPAPRLLLLATALLATAARPVGANMLDRWWGEITGETPSAPAGKPAAATAPATAPAPTVTAQAAPPAPVAPALPVIPVMRPRIQSVSETMELTGNAAAVNQVKLVARVPGWLDQIHFDDGALVRKNDLLFTVQQDQYKAQLQQAQAQLMQQQAALAHAKLERGRYSALLKKDAATQVDVDHWAFEQQTAEAGILGAQAQVALAQLNLSYTEVRAPFDGQMGRHLIDAGNLVGTGGQDAVLAEITQLDPIYVVVNISTQQALQVRQNLSQRRLTLEQLRQIPIEAGLQDETGFPHRGMIQFVAPQIDQTTGTLLVRGLLRNPDRTLLPGMFVRVRLPLGKELSRALLVPDAALQDDQGGRFLLTVAVDGTVQKAYVQIGTLVGNLRVITSGIGPDDQVIVGELWRAAPGAKVTPRLTAGQ